MSTTACVSIACLLLSIKVAYNALNFSYRYDDAYGMIILFSDIMLLPSAFI